MKQFSKILFITLFVVFSVVTSAQIVTSADHKRQRNTAQKHKIEQGQTAFEREMAKTPVRRVKGKKADKSAADATQVPQAKLVKAAKPSKSSKATKTNASVVVTPLNAITTASAYKALLGEQVVLSDQIGALSSQLSGSNKGQSKKISKQIGALTKQLNSVERRLATFPESIKNPSASILQIDELFERQFDSIIAARIASSDPYAGRISTDAELERMYRTYLGASGVSPLVGSGDDSGSVAGGGGVTYRIMLAISKSPIPMSAFKGLSAVMEQRMPSGGVVYYSGSYSSRSQADAACNRILSERRFRDAFVVAMVGNKRVEMPR